MRATVTKEEAQSIVYYRDACKMTFRRIAKILNRAQLTITKHYHKEKNYNCVAIKKL